MPNSKQIVYLSQAQYAELIANGSITVNGVTVEYNENDLYVTPQAEPVTDVKINGTSVVTNGVANVPLADTQTAGAIQLMPSGGLSLNSQHLLYLYPANDSDIKSGTGYYKPITSNSQHKAAFYALAKAAGDSTQSASSNAIGTYTDDAKQKIQNMLGITGLISTEETTTATAAHALNSLFLMGGKLYKATAAIAIGDAVEVGTNCEAVKADEVFPHDVQVNGTSVMTNGVANVPLATSSIPGAVKVGNGLMMWGQSELRIYGATLNSAKGGTNEFNPVTPSHQHESVFYGLAKVAGADEKNSTLPAGQYTETAKFAIRNMLGAASTNIVAVQDEQPTDTDTKVWLPGTQAAGVQVPTMEDMQNYVQKTDLASSSSAGIVKIVSSYGVYAGSNGEVIINKAGSGIIKSGSNNYTPIVPTNQHEAVFYGLAKAAGDLTQKESDNAVGTYTADASAAIRNMIGAIGTEDIATSSTAGIVKIRADIGVGINDNGELYVYKAADSVVKTGEGDYRPIVPRNQHAAAFYGLAKAAGDVTQRVSSNAIGTYTAEAKSAIQSMLGIDLQSIASEVEIPLVETVSGTTPSITGQPNTRYVCGEVSTLSITPPSAGSIDVIFDSGSTPAVITVPNTVRWPAWFDATALEADTTYEILITDGVYGSVMAWAN